MTTLSRKLWRWDRLTLIAVAVCFCLGAVICNRAFRASPLEREIKQRGGQFESEELNRTPMAVVSNLVFRTPRPQRFHFVTFDGQLFDDEWIKTHRDELAELTALSLTIRNTKITDVGLEQFRKLKNFHYLKLDGDGFTNASLHSVATLPHLTQIDISDSNIHGPALVVLKESPYLSCLTVSGSQLKQGAIPAIQKLPKLACLIVTAPTDAAIEKLAKTTIPKLSHLWLRGSDVTDSSVSHLTQLSQLEILTLIETEISEDGLALLKTALPLCNIQCYKGDEYDELMASFED